MAPLEPWEKVLVNFDEFSQTPHGSIGCTYCHSGVQSGDKVEAHTGLVAKPSDQSEDFCQICHYEIGLSAKTSLHQTLEGYWTNLNQRTITADHPALQEMFGNHCESCHASCGDCHVSQPGSVGGGFIDGHLFNATPSMTRNCTACHGSRVGNEFLGKHEGLKADVHFRQGRMNCIDCHTGQDMHGQTGVAMQEGTEIVHEQVETHRLDGEQNPNCETCHDQVQMGSDGNPNHVMHSENLSCQVCHSVSYTSCDGCHVAVSETTGNPYFSTEGSTLGFYIGLNPRQNDSRPYKYVTLRHVPVSPTSFEFYGDNLLSRFDNLTTWVYATPHNIQRFTPQNETCEACHGNEEIFLTVDKVNPEEIDANKSVIVDKVPDPFGAGSDE